jgi:hypothetical protein
MSAPSKDIELEPHALAIDVWENEGRAPGPDTLDHQYGKARCELPSPDSMPIEAVCQP